MKTRLITRRRAIVTGLAAAGGLLATRLPGDLPPTYGHLLRAGDTFTYAAQRVLLPSQSLVQEYARGDVTSFPATGTIDPGTLDLPGLSEAFRALQHGGFADWRLPVEGHVAAPRAFSLVDLTAMAARTQITRHTCEEGWSAIGEWTGVPLRRVLETAGILPSARFVNFYTYDDTADGLDMLDALHPQTIIAYGMNGRDLPIPHGAPVRLRVETQLGYKSVKYLQRIIVTDEFDDLGKLGPLQNGWSWYAGI